MATKITINPIATFGLPNISAEYEQGSDSIEITNDVTDEDVCELIEPLPLISSIVNTSALSTVSGPSVSLFESLFDMPLPNLTSSTTIQSNPSDSGHKISIGAGDRVVGKLGVSRLNCAVPVSTVIPHVPKRAMHSTSSSSASLTVSNGADVPSRMRRSVMSHARIINDADLDHALPRSDIRANKRPNRVSRLHGGLQGSGSRPDKHELSDIRSMVYQRVHAIEQNDFGGLSLSHAHIPQLGV